MSEEDKDDKTHDPSQRKLDEARKQGEVVRSADLTAAAAFGGLVLALVVAGVGSLQQFGNLGMALIAQSGTLGRDPLQHGSRVAGDILQAAGLAVLPFLALPMAASLLALLAQRGLVFAPAKLIPRLSRLSPFANAGHKFGREGLFEFAKSLVKLVAVSGLLGLHLAWCAPLIRGMAGLEPALAMGLTLQILIEFLAFVLALTLLTGVADWFWQGAQHLRRNRMSHKDLTDEAKDSEGDPHMKAHRRQRAQEIATNRMLQDVAKADVVIVNPTHYAVALRWKRSDRGAPVCVAKGVDEIAARIRERAALAGVPLHSDPPTARALFAAIEIGQQIRPEHYKAVAAAIRVAEALRKRQKGNFHAGG